MSNATLEEVKQAEKEAQRAYSKGTGTLEAAQEAGRAVHRVREQLWREERDAELALLREERDAELALQRMDQEVERELRQKRVDAAIEICLPMLRVVTSRNPGFLVFKLGERCLGVPHYVTGNEKNTLFLVTKEPVGEAIGKFRKRQLIEAAMGYGETLELLESAAKKIVNQNL